MAEQTSYGPVATHLRFENEHVRVWEMDLATGQRCGLIGIRSTTFCTSSMAAGSRWSRPG